MARTNTLRLSSPRHWAIHEVSTNYNLKLPKYIGFFAMSVRITRNMIAEIFVGKGDTMAAKHRDQKNINNKKVKKLNSPVELRPSIRYIALTHMLQLPIWNIWETCLAAMEVPEQNGHSNSSLVNAIKHAVRQMYRPCIDICQVLLPAAYRVEHD